MKTIHEAWDTANNRLSEVNAYVSRLGKKRTCNRLLSNNYIEIH